MRSLICEDWEKGKGKGEKDLLIYFHNEVYAQALASRRPLG
jgi:hypothetical protein